MPSFVAILEDNSDRLTQMRACLAELLPQFQHVFFESAPLMILWLKEHFWQVVLISLDHDLPLAGDCGAGREVADFLATQSPVCPVIVHTSNEFFAPGMMMALADAGWPIARIYPHGDHNWIERGWRAEIQKMFGAGWIFGSGDELADLPRRAGPSPARNTSFKNQTEISTRTPTGAGTPRLSFNQNRFPPIVTGTGCGPGT